MAVHGAPRMAYGASMARKEERAGSFAGYIRHARKARGWTQEELADHSGLGVRTVIRWELGEVTEPDARQVIAAADALEVEPEDAFYALGWLRRKDDTVVVAPDPEPEEEEDFIERAERLMAEAQELLSEGKRRNREAG